MPMKHWFWFVLCLCGCGLFARSGPSEVAQGHYFASGSAEFDAFFLELFQLQVHLERVPDDLSRTRAELADTLVLARDAANAQLSEKLRLELKKLRAQGHRVKLDVQVPRPPDPERTHVVLHTTPPPTGAHRKLLTEVERSTTHLARLSASLLAIERRLDELRATAVVLEERVDVTFQRQGVTHRREVRRNLGDAQRLLVLMLARAKSVEQGAAELLDELTAVARAEEETSPPEQASPEATPAVERATKPARVRSRSAAPARPTKASAPRSAAATRSAEPSEEPAPKAPAAETPTRDFEP